MAHENKSFNLSFQEKKRNIDFPLRTRSSVEVKWGAECPHLDTINRGALDFDFEKCCSVSLRPTNVYACLVCGKYFQGRGHTTYAYAHCLEFSHHMFMRLEDGTVWCLPEGYKVEDRSLDDIVSLLDPTFSIQEIDDLQKSPCWSRALNGTEFIPGLVGLNNMKANSYANVVIQIIARVSPIRDFFLNKNNCSNKSSPLLRRTGELLRKIWHPKQFKGQVSPYEFLRAVIAESETKFSTEKEGDPVLFLAWLLNSLQSAIAREMTKHQTIVTATFQGEMELWDEEESGTDSHTNKANETPMHIKKRLPFFMLSLDLPRTPLFKDTYDRMQIPQIPLFQLLKKYDPETICEDVRTGFRRYRITRLPNFLILSVRRFTKNSFFLEKNSSIINFPIKNLDLKDVIPVPDQEPSTKYDLIASVSHEGKVGDGSYKVYINRYANDLWYEVQDLTVVEVLPQMVALSETYLQVYERRQPSLNE